MNQNFSKSKIVHESSELEHFQLEGGGGGGANFRPLNSLDFQQLSDYNILDWGQKFIR